MIKSKDFLMLCAFSLLCSTLGAKDAGAYTLTFKPKFQCEDGELFLHGGCIDSNSEELYIEPEDDVRDTDDSGWVYAFSTKSPLAPTMNTNRMGIRGVYAAKRAHFKKWA